MATHLTVLSCAAQYTFLASVGSNPLFEPPIARLIESYVGTVLTSGGTSDCGTESALIFMGSLNGLTCFACLSPVFLCVDVKFDVNPRFQRQPRGSSILRKLFALN